MWANRFITLRIFSSFSFSSVACVYAKARAHVLTKAYNGIKLHGLNLLYNFLEEKCIVCRAF